MTEIQLHSVQGEARADSRDLAEGDIIQPDPYALLATAIQCGLEGRTADAARLIRTARSIASPEQQSDVAMLAMAASGELAWCIKHQRLNRGSPHNEYATVQFWFRTNFTRLLPQAELVEVPSRPGYRPDFMTRERGLLIPVECKKVFNPRALNQLLAYLEAFGSSEGIAVGFRLTCRLPDNIVFLECPEEAGHG